LDAPLDDLRNHSIIYAIGDSITRGSSPSDVINSYPYWLDYYLGSNVSSVSGASNVYNKGHGGYTCDQIYTAYDSDVPNNIVNYTLLLCGTNDIAIAGSDVDEITTDLELIYNKSVEKNTTLVMMTLLPRITESYCDEIVGVNNWLRNFTRDNNILLVDLYNVFYNGTDCIPKFGLFIEGLHPSKEGYELLGKTIWEDVFNSSYYGWSSNLTLSPTTSILGGANVSYDFKVVADGVTYIDNSTLNVFASYSELAEEKWPLVKASNQFTPPVVNNENLVLKAIQPMKQLLGDENVIQVEPLTVGEDFGNLIIPI